DLRHRAVRHRARVAAARGRHLGARAQRPRRQRAGRALQARRRPRATPMTMAATTREHEFKFLVPDDFEMPGLDDLCARAGDTVVEPTATYYDTNALRLARAGASLRFRDDDGWTVKLPSEPEAGNGPAPVRSECGFRGRCAW